jgi:hypothetical protein
MRRAFQIIAALTAMVLPTLKAAPLLTLDPPSGAIFAAAGETTGWGFTLTNTTDFLLVNGADFCEGPITSPCSNALGTFADFLGPRATLLVVGPAPENPSVTEAFDLGFQTGVGSFTVNGGALIGDTVSGQVVLTYSLYSRSPNDPNFDPTTDALFNGDSFTLTSEASVTVVALPEPGTSVLLGSAILILGFPRLRRKLSA